jgi:hypothetical protein
MGINNGKDSGRVPKSLTYFYVFLNLLFFGRGCELLKTVSTRISQHFPNMDDVLVFSHLVNDSCHDPNENHITYPRNLLAASSQGLKLGLKYLDHPSTQDF